MEQPLSFEAFAASRVHVDNLDDALGADFGGEDPTSGFTYADRGAYIQDNRPDSPVPGKYYLLIERSDWISDDLTFLEEILWAEFYLFETAGAADVVCLNVGDGTLDAFVRGTCNARGWTIDGGVFSVFFSGADDYTPRDAADIISKAVDAYRPSPAQNARDIAAAFVKGLRGALTAEEFEEVRRRNATPEYGEGVCASHDFCDANMIMEPAFKEVMGREIDLQSDDDLRLWGAAWDIAKEGELTARD